MKFEAYDSEEKKAPWKIVRLDTFQDISGQIVTADELTGECSVKNGDETKNFSLGERGLSIISRKR